MDGKLYFTCLWPGLPELWWRGRLTALPAAFAFMLALNFFLIARFLYPEWLTLSLVRMGGWVGALVWVFLVIRSVRELPALIHPRQVADAPDRFVDAHHAYLRQDWGAAEALLVDCLAIENRDPPALLLLAGVYRHTGRFEAALRQLDEIRRTEVADRWWLEVEAEAKRLARDHRYHVEANSGPDASQQEATALPEKPTTRDSDDEVSESPERQSAARSTPFVDPS